MLHSCRKKKRCSKAGQHILSPQETETFLHTSSPFVGMCLAGTDRKECELQVGSKVLTCEDSLVPALTNADHKIASGETGNLIAY